MTSTQAVVAIQFPKKLKNSGAAVCRKRNGEYGFKETESALNTSAAEAHAVAYSEGNKLQIKSSSFCKKTTEELALKMVLFT